VRSSFWVEKNGESRAVRDVRSIVRLLRAPLFRWRVPIQQQVNRFEGSILQVGKDQQTGHRARRRMAACLAPT
jgi:hypothetical protein